MPEEVKCCIDDYSYQPGLTSLQIAEEIRGTFAHLGENFVAQTEKVFYQLGDGGKAIERRPPFLPLFRNNPLFFLFVIFKDSKAFMTPSR